MKKHSAAPRRSALALARGIRALAKQLPSRGEPLELPGQPFDRLLLKSSPIYRKSRELFVALGGAYEPSLLSSPRSLGSLSLVSARLEYSPLEAELLWTASDRRELATRPERLLDLRSWVTSVFHEQNHRILWHLLPPPPRRADAHLRRYLHFAESLVVMLDLALADRLGAKVCRSLYEAGALYDPGAEFFRELQRFGRKKADRYHRNALLAACEATFLNLELHAPSEIPGHIESLFPREASPAATRGNSLIRRAAERALRLDRQFVEQTNPEWLRRHGKRAGEALRRLRAGPSSTETEEMLLLGENAEALFTRQLLAEQVLDRFLI